MVKNQDKIAELIVLENGKTLADAKGDVFRGIEVIEHARSVTSLMQGESMENIAKDIDC